MKTRVLSSALILASLSTLSAAIVNPGFEEPAGAGPASGWTDTSTTFGYVRCDASCGGVGPHSGSYWAWLGGTTNKEIATVSQQILIGNASTAVISAYIWYSGDSTSADSIFTVSLDSTVLLTILGNQTPGAAWTLMSWDVTSFADGGNHTLQFQLVQPVVPKSFNVHVDDVSLTLRALADITDTPEPATWVMLSAGLGLVAIRRMQDSRSS